MSRAMFVAGYKGEVPAGVEAREAVAVNLSFGDGEAGVTDTDDEPDALGCVLIEVAKLDPAIRFLRVYCL